MHGWSDATRLDTTMLMFTGSQERTESEYQDLLHRAGLTFVKTTPTALAVGAHVESCGQFVGNRNPRKDR
jgi:hypothetical protein